MANTDLSAFATGGLRRVKQAAHGLAAGDFVRVNSDGEYVKALAVAEDETSAPQAEVIAVVSEVRSPDVFVANHWGFYELPASFDDLTPGLAYFLDPEEAGGFTDTAPSDEGEVRKPLFVAISPRLVRLAFDMIGFIIPGDGGGD
jgi:hypothetical protein